MAKRGPKKAGIRDTTIQKMHMIVRLRQAYPALTLGEIGKLVGLSQWRMHVISSTPIYQQIQSQYITGLVTSLDTKVKDRYGLVQETLEFAVPIAMQNLLQQAMQDKDKKLQNKACNDLLDRHGRFAKVSRMDVKNESTVAGEVSDNEAAMLLVKALNTVNSALVNGPPAAPALTIDTPTVTETHQ